MTRILKWDVPVDDERHEIGSGRVIHVSCQFNPEIVEVWTEEFPGLPVMIEAQVYGTGMRYPKNGQAVGSAVTLNGQIVWHVITFPNLRKPPVE